MDLEGEMTVQMPQSNYLHESSKLKLMGSGNGPTAAVEAVAIRPPFEAITTAPAAAATTGGPVVAANNNNGNNNNNNNNNNVNSSKKVRYRECQKNHAAGIGGHALDGCGEFMPSGEEGTLEGLKCSACDCHRNFHRREVEGEPPSCDCWYKKDLKKKPSLLHTSPLAAISPSGTRSPAALMALSGGHSDQSDEQDGGLGGHHYSLAHHLGASAIKKRFRTKFTGEQKEKMFNFADKLGWRIQKHDEAEVQQFCADVGVKRHVLKVWMHNNKNTYGKKL